MKAIIALFAITFLCVQAAVPGGYTEVDPEEVEASPILKDLLEFGQQQFLEKAYQAKTISATDLSLVDIISAYQQVVSGLNVEFTVELADSNGKPVNATFTVFYQPWTGKKELISYKINNQTNFLN